MSSLQKVTCGYCGAEHLPNTLYCDECGHSLLPGVRGEAFSGEARNARVAPSRALTGRQVQLVSRDGARQLRFLLSGSLLLGRADPAGAFRPDLEIGPSDGSGHGVSRRHARLLVMDGQIQLEDLNSLNGTFVQGRRLVAGHPYPLQPGDELQFGKEVFSIHW